MTGYSRLAMYDSGRERQQLLYSLRSLVVRVGPELAELGR